MKNCVNCGNKLREKDKYCSDCGIKIEDKNEKKTEDKDIEENKGISVLSYLGILALIPYFLAKDSKFARYHSIQGMNFLIVWIAYAIIFKVSIFIKIVEYSNYWYETYSSPIFLMIILYVIGAGLTVLSIIGIINVCNGEVKELPIIGKIKIIK